MTTLQKKPIIFLSAVIVMVLSDLFLAAKINQISLGYYYNANSTYLLDNYLPDHQRINSWLAINAINEDQPQLAITWLDHLPVKDDPYTKNLKAQAFLGTGDFQRAITLWEDINCYECLRYAGSQALLMEDIDSAVLAYQSAWNLDQNSGTLTLANTYWAENTNRELAIETLKSGINKFPSSPLRLYWFIRIGEFLEAQQDWVEMGHYYQQAIHEYPDEWVFYVGLAKASYEMKAPVEQVFKLLHSALEIENVGSVYKVMADISLREEDFQGAEMYYMEAGRLHESEQNWLQSYNMYQQALAINSDNLTARSAVERLSDNIP